MDDDARIGAILDAGKTIAVVGLSPDGQRPSHVVARYMQAQGYRILPINPTCAGKEILGETCHPTITSAVSAIATQGRCLDIVVCFRRPEHMPAIVAEAIAAGAAAIWMQHGVSHPGAAERAIQAGLAVIMDRCIKIEHAARRRTAEA